MKTAAVVLAAACMLLGVGRPAVAATHRPVVYEIAIDGGIDPPVARAAADAHAGGSAHLARPARRIVDLDALDHQGDPRVQGDPCVEVPVGCAGRSTHFARGVCWICATRVVSE
jgi:hypothetical protein